MTLHPGLKHLGYSVRPLRGHRKMSKHQGRRKRRPSSSCSLPNRSKTTTERCWTIFKIQPPVNGTTQTKSPSASKGGTTEPVPPQGTPEKPQSEFRSITSELLIPGGGGLRFTERK